MAETFPKWVKTPDDFIRYRQGLGPPSKRPRIKTCPYCKMEIPAGASTCPYCRKDQPSAAKGLIYLIMIFFAGLFVFGIWNPFSYDSQPSTSSPASVPAPTRSSVPSSPALIVSASTILAHYKANEVAADDYYKGKYIEVEGKIRSITKNAFDIPVVSLEAGSSFDTVDCHYPKGSNRPASYMRGENVTIEGYCKGMILGSILIDIP